MENLTNPKTVIATVKQVLALSGFIAGVIAEMLMGSEVQYWLQNKSTLKVKIQELFGFHDVYWQLRQEWQRIYKDDFVIDVDFANVRVPEKPEGNYCLLAIAKGLTCNQAFDSWKFPKWRWTKDIDGSLKKNVRNSDESYFVWVLMSQEPDVEFLGRSTNQADPNMEIGITLLERMVFESYYFKKTGNHLDVEGLTFCSGSRVSGGDVPSVDLFSDGEVNVNWNNLENSDARYGVRRVVA